MMPMTIVLPVEALLKLRALGGRLSLTIAQTGSGMNTTLGRPVLTERLNADILWDVIAPSPTERSYSKASRRTC